MKILFNILQIVSLGAGALVGMIGVLGDFRDDQRRLTHWGWGTLGLLGFTLLVGVISQIAQTVIQSRDERESERRQKEQMAVAQQAAIDIRRNMTRIEKLSSRLVVELSEDNPPVARLLKQVAESFPPGVDPTYRTFRAYPPIDNEARAIGDMQWWSNASGALWCVIIIDSSKVPLDSLRFSQSQPGMSFSISAYGEWNGTENPRAWEPYLESDLKNRAVIATWTIPAARDLRHDESVASTYDFPGKTVIIYCIDQTLHVRPAQLVLSTPSQMSLVVDRFDAKKIDGRICFVATLQADAEWN